MNRSPSAMSSSTIQRSSSCRRRRARYSENSIGFSGSSVLERVQAREPSGWGMRSKTREGTPLAQQTTSMVPASRSPLARTVAKPPAVSTARIRPFTSIWAGRRASTIRQAEGTWYPARLESGMRERMNVPVPRPISSPVSSTSLASATKTRRRPLIQRPSARTSPATTGLVK